MAGLFTLDDTALGVLDTSPLGGFGTGFSTGSGISAGSVIGFQGFSGSAIGTGTSQGAISGSVGYTGTITGSSSSVGTASGVTGFSGSVSGSQISSGSATGVEGNTGTAEGSTTAAGSAAGNPQMTGSAIGSSNNDGSATGTKSEPEPPVPPAPAEGVGSAAPRWYLPRAEPIRHTGNARGRQASRGSVTGLCSMSGSATGSTVTRSTIIGRRRLPIAIEQKVIDHAAIRRRAEDEALILEIL